MANRRTYVSRIDSKCRATVPAAIRSALGIEAGDKVGFDLVAPRMVLLRRIAAEEGHLLGTVLSSFEDWSDPEAERAFRYL